MLKLKGLVPYFWLLCAGEASAVNVACRWIPSRVRCNAHLYNGESNENSFL